MKVERRILYLIRDYYSIDENVEAYKRSVPHRPKHEHASTDREMDKFLSYKAS